MPCWGNIPSTTLFQGWLYRRIGRLRYAVTFPLVLIIVDANRQLALNTYDVACCRKSLGLDQLRDPSIAQQGLQLEDGMNIHSNRGNGRGIRSVSRGCHPFRLL
jgi:hypothetical protein